MLNTLFWLSVFGLGILFMGKDFILYVFLATIVFVILRIGKPEWFV